MSLAAALALAFVLPLAFYVPEPESLRDAARPALAQRLAAIRATLALGLLIIVVAGLTFTGGRLAPSWAALWGLSRAGVLGNGWLFQLATNSLVHFDLLHLVANLSLLMLLSSYERRAGARRFLAVFIVCALASSVADLALLPARTVSLGASGGLCGLAAAWFLDVPQTSGRVWLYGLAGVLLLVALYSFEPRLKGDYNVNWVAHLIGAGAGAVYVRLGSRG